MTSKTKDKNLPRRSRLAQGQGAADLMADASAADPFILGIDLFDN